MRYALGIDGGGSKCEALLVDEDGNVAGRGLGGPIHGYYDPPETILGSYREAIPEAVRGVRGAEITAAGQVPRVEVLAAAINGAGELIESAVAKESVTARASAQVTWGLVLEAGTGSFVHGRTEEGEELHYGGLGPTLGDEGSAYAIGLAGLRAAFASARGPAADLAGEGAAGGAGGGGPVGSLQARVCRADEAPRDRLASTRGR